MRRNLRSVSDEALVVGEIRVEVDEGGRPGARRRVRDKDIQACLIA